MKKYKQKLSENPSSGIKFDADVFKLLKWKFSNSDEEIKSDSDRVLQSLFSTATFDEEHDTIHMELEWFKSLYHKKFTSILQKHMKGKITKRQDEKIEMTTMPIKIPYTRNQEALSTARIIAESMSKRTLKLSIIGPTGMVILMYHMKKVIELFLNSVNESLEKAIKSSEEDSSSNIESETSTSRTSKEIDKTMEDEIDPSPHNNDDKNDDVNMEVDSDHNKEKDTNFMETQQDKCDGLTQESDASSTKRSEDKEKTIEDGFNPSVHNKDDKRDDENPKINTDDQRETELEDGPPQECPECALIFAGQNIHLFFDHKIKIQLKCKWVCYKIPDTFRYFLEQLNREIRTRGLGRRMPKILQENINNLFHDVLSMIVDGKAKMYNTIMEDLVLFDLRMQSRIIQFWEIFLPDLAENEGESFERTLKENTLGRKNLVSFLSDARDFLSIWSAVNSLFILYQEDVVLHSLLPSALHFIPDDLKDMIKRQGDDNDVHVGITLITQKVVKKTGNENIQILELKNEVKITKLFEKLTSYPVLHLYLDKEQKTFLHFCLVDENNFTVEFLLLDKMVMDTKMNSLSSSKWRFFLKENLDFIISDLLEKNIDNNEKVDEKNKYEKKRDEKKKDEKKQDERRKDEKKKNEKKKDEKKKDEDQWKSKYQKHKPASPTILETETQAFPAESESGSESFSEVDDEPESGLIQDSFWIKEDLLYKYWDPHRNMNERHFLRYESGRDWPQMFGSPCAVKIGYSHAKVLNSLKESCAFAVLKGTCKMCSARFHFSIDENPFQEELKDDGSISCQIIKPMLVDVRVTGKFFKKDGKLDITNPVHDKSKATGLQLRGEERKLLADMATQRGSYFTYQEQMAFAKKEQIEVGNKTSIRSYGVIKQAMYERERPLRVGETIAESVRNVYRTQKPEESSNFDTNASKSLTGLIRSFQEIPFKLHLATHDQLKIGAHYFRQENSAVCIDSSGKFMKRQSKVEKKRLNTALVIPPPAKGESPFPISEMISEENKTVDFLEFLQRSWSLMSKANNDENVNCPRVGITDFSFPNIHSFLQFFNQTKIMDYLNTIFNMFITKEKFPFSTVITICESHLIPVFLKTARANHADKTVADTFIAGVLVVLQAKTFQEAYSIWKDLVKIHCSKIVDHEARQKFKVQEYGNSKMDDIMTDFDNDETEEESLAYGKRAGIRLSSPFFAFFRRAYEKIMKEEQNISAVENHFFSPNLVEVFIREYLSLFPFLSASMLEDGLRNNAYVELWWKEQRRMLKDTPNRLLWPPAYLGMYNAHLKKKSTEILLHNIIPTLKFGKKSVSEKRVRFPDVEKNPQDFVPSSAKKKGKSSHKADSFDGAKETWDSKRGKGPKNKTYVKGKTVDHTNLAQSLDTSTEGIVVTGRNPTANEFPQRISLSPNDIMSIKTRHRYINTEVVDAALSLIDRKLCETGNQGITVYSVQDTRVILTVNPNQAISGPFLTIMPRDSAVAQEENRYEAFKQNRVVADAGSHYTMISNIGCAENEVNVFETFQPFRSPSSLLSDDGKRLLKILCHSKEEPLKVNAINVKIQDECECGALAFGLGK